MRCHSPARQACPAARHIAAAGHTAATTANTSKPPPSQATAVGVQQPNILVPHNAAATPARGARRGHPTLHTTMSPALHYCGHRPPKSGCWSSSGEGPDPPPSPQNRVRRATKPSDRTTCADAKGQLRQSRPCDENLAAPGKPRQRREPPRPSQIRPAEVPPWAIREPRRRHPGRPHILVGGLLRWRCSWREERGGEGAAARVAQAGGRHGGPGALGANYNLVIILMWCHKY